MDKSLRINLNSKYDGELKNLKFKVLQIYGNTYLYTYWSIYKSISMFAFDEVVEVYIQ